MPDDSPRETLLQALKSAIDRTAAAWSQDPEQKELLEAFRAFARKRGVDMAALAAMSGPSRNDTADSTSHTNRNDQNSAAIAEAERALAALRAHAKLIEHGIGPYSDPVRRLRAQRALRELPDRIERMKRSLPG